MKIRVLGGGLYGCHLAVALLDAGHDVVVHETARRLFSGASGGNPARLHLGFHYPRSALTRQACQTHQAEFMARYGAITRSIATNVYAIAEDSLVDFGTYCKVLSGEVEFEPVDPAAYGLRHVEGAVLTKERHVVIREAMAYFSERLAEHVKFEADPAAMVDDPCWDYSIDATFCALDAKDIDRYEPCLTVLLEGPTDRSITIMDGPFGSLYTWDEDRSLSTLTSAKFTPLSKTCRSYKEARAVIDFATTQQIDDRAELMLADIARYWPAVRDRYKIAGHKLRVRAMPRSAADARLVDVIRVGERAMRVRAGKIDAIFHAERLIKAMIA